MTHGRAAAMTAVALGVTLGIGILAPSASATDHVSGRSGQGAVHSGAVPAITRALPAESDPPGTYEAQAVCSPRPKPGTVLLANLIKKTYGQDVIGISRGCGVGDTSEHKEGRALDWMTSVRDAQGRANAEAFLAWLLGPDQFGVVAGNATRLGVMYIGWNNRFWRAYDVGRGWTELDTCLSDPPSGDDTTCHRNHVHISLTWDGASGRTSFWDGTPLAPFCASARSSAAVLPGGRSPDVVAVPAVRVLSTRDGIGLVGSSGFGGGADWSGFNRDGRHDGDWSDDGDGSDDGAPSWSDDGGTGDAGFASPEPVIPTGPPPPVAPCRVHPSGWRGDVGGVLTKVTGQGGVPETGVVAVVVRVRAIGSTAPADITVWGPGQDTHAVVANVRLNRQAHGSAIVPVATDGTIALGTSAGGTDLTVDVTGYYLAGDQPNLTTAL